VPGGVRDGTPPGKGSRQVGGEGDWGNRGILLGGGRTGWGGQLTSFSAYPAIKGLHLGFVAITVTLFLLRGMWALVQGTPPARRWARILPHANDTLLLASGVGLAYLSGYWSHPWLVAKLGGIVLYIGLGLLALRPGSTRAQRAAAFAAALTVLGYIIAVALAKQALPGT